MRAKLNRMILPRETIFDNIMVKVMTGEGLLAPKTKW